MQIFEHIKKAADERRLGLHKNSLCRAGRIRTHNLLTINQALYQFRATALQSKQKLHKKFPLWMWVGPSHRPRARRARALPAELHIHKENSKEQKFKRFVLAATYFPLRGLYTFCPAPVLAHKKTGAGSKGLAKRGFPLLHPMCVEYHRRNRISLPGS